MSTNITTLALNLLISERLSHRNFIATKITDLISCVNHDSEKDRLTKDAFISVLRQCISNPTCHYRDLFFQYAEYYNKKLVSQESMTPAA